MDLARLSPRKAAAIGVDLHLKDPATSEPLMDGETPATITLLGSDAEQVKEKRREIDRRRTEGEEISQDAALAEVLATATTGWWGGLTLHGDALPYSYENALRLYSDPDTQWICNQAAAFFLNPRNYVKNRPTA